MKKLQKLFATLLAVCMVMSMLSVNAFAAEKTSAIQIVEDGGMVYYLADPQEGDVAGENNFDVWTSKTIEGTEKEDEFVVTLQVGTTMKAIPNDVAVVLVMDVSGSMMMDENGTLWYNNDMPSDKRPRIDYAREAALEFAETYVENSGNAQRMLSVVQFGNNATTVLPWTDVNDGGELKDSAKEAIESVEVNFLIEGNKDYWEEEQALTDFGKIDYWDTTEVPAVMEDAFKDYFQSYSQAAVMTDYYETVQQEVEGTPIDVSVCTFNGCTLTESHRHCDKSGCVVVQDHFHCSECEETTNHKHCSYEACTKTEADHKHCGYEGCDVADIHAHCKRCGLTTEDHTHVAGCTLKKCQDPYVGPHTHCCVHGGDSMDPYYCIHSRWNHEYPYRCGDPTPDHTHDLLDADRYCLVTDKYFGAVWNVGTNMEGGLMLARNLLNAGLADGGAIEGVDDVYVILLSDGNPTWVTSESSATELEFLKGEKDLTSNSKWAAIEEIVSSGEEGDAAIAEDIKAKAELCAILYGASLNNKLGGNHELSNVTGAEWFKGTGKNYVGADLIVDSPESDGIEEAFLSINRRIDILAKAWTVTDELSDDVTFLEFGENGTYAGFTPASGDKNAAVSWSLGNMTPESGDGSMSNPYIYTLKYKVKLNSAQDNVKATSLAHDADTSLDGIWTGTNTKLQYFMIDKKQLDTMTPDQIEAKLRAAAFEDLSVKGIYGDYEFIKKDKETDGVIEGVGFTLYDASGKAYGSEVFSDSEGKVVFTDIPRGDYTLKETTVPDGMQQMSDLDSRISWGEITAVNGGEMPDVIYNWPVGAEIPDGGGTGNPGGNDGGEGGSTPSGPSNPSGPSKPTTPSVPTEEIEEEDVPLGDLPTGDDVEIGEEDVPLTALPDEEPPLAMAPATGDVSALWLALSALSGTGLAGVSLLGRKKRDEE